MAKLGCLQSHGIEDTEDGTFKVVFTSETEFDDEHEARQHLISLLSEAPIYTFTPDKLKPIKGGKSSK